MPDRLIVTVAAIGAELTRTDQPNLPITPEEIAADARRCEDAGAAIYHLHARDESGRPTMDVQKFSEARAAIEERTNLIVQFTSGGAVEDSEEARIGPLDLKPEMASLTTGSVNFGDEVFWNPGPLVERFYRKMRAMGILPEFEIFEPGMIANALSMYERHGDGHHCHYDFVLGVPGALPAWPDVVPWLVSRLPPAATWSATGIGKAHLPVAETTLEHGGHVRTGFEDVKYYESGRLADSNAQLIERVVLMARERGREAASPAETRRMLGLDTDTG